MTTSVEQDQQFKSLITEIDNAFMTNKGCADYIYTEVEGILERLDTLRKELHDE